MNTTMTMATFFTEVCTRLLWIIPQIAMVAVIVSVAIAVIAITYYTMYGKEE